VRLNALPATRTFTITDDYYDVSSTGVSVACANGLGKGEVTSTETVGKVSMTLNSCVGEKGGEECTVKSAGAKGEGEIIIKTLKGELGEVASSEAYTEGGLLLEPETGKAVASFEGKCIPSASLEGSFAVEVLPDEFTTKIIEGYLAANSSKQLIQAITVKTGERKTSKKAKLEIAGLAATMEALQEAEFTENVEIL
jgi:hypothetical protein